MCAIPVEKGAGDEVIGGSVNQSGALVVNRNAYPARKIVGGPKWKNPKCRLRPKPVGEKAAHHF